ncbi:MAG: hypothetical protein U9R79_15950 [Armatimonadota bacterium]|nr:hypothetical protein [Armatimonadota bacterium]
MLCPQCHQGVQQQELEDGKCPYCGFPCHEFSRRVTQIQIILGAIFASTLVYGILVAVLELYTGYRGPGLGDSELVLGMALIGASAGIFAASAMFERRALELETTVSYVRIAIVLGAIAEVPAVFGLVMYLLTGSLPWLVLFLAASWALFIRLGLRLPVILRGIADCLRTE